MRKLFERSDWPLGLLLVVSLAMLMAGLFMRNVDVGSDVQQPVRASMLTSVEAESVFEREREDDITERIAPKYNAETQVRLPDGTICDMLTETHAIEVERATGWKEAAGQALWYASQTGKKPGVVLLVSDPDREWKYIARAAWLCGRGDVTIWWEEIE